MPATELPPDPVIEAYKQHVDVTLLKQSLERTAEERIAALMSMDELVTEMRRALRRP